MGWNYLFIPKLQCCSCWSLGIWLCTVLYGLPKFLIEKLQRVQNFSAQLFYGSYKYDHITPVLKSLHWLPVEQRIWYKIAVLGFKCVFGSAPSYLQNHRRYTSQDTPDIRCMRVVERVCVMYTLEGTQQSRLKPWTLMRNSQRTS